MLAPMITHSQYGVIRRKLILWLGIPSLIVVLFAVWVAVVKHRDEHARKLWKDEALVQLAKTSLTSEEVRTEIAQLKHPTPNLDLGWTHEQVLLMTNGEFMVFAFRHGFDDGFIDHLFLAHGSDGRWYYSTHHFCNQMRGSGQAGQPGAKHGRPEVRLKSKAKTRKRRQSVI